MLTYLEFHVVFILPALAISLVLGRTGYHRRPQTTVFGIALMVFLALVYTTPWDSYLISLGAWGYGDSVVTMRLWNVPLGEYMFFTLQAVVTGGWASYVFSDRQTERFGIDVQDALLGGAGGFVVSAIGLYLVFGLGGTMLYMGAILAWAGPVLALQWAFGWRHLLRHSKTLALGFGIPTLYLILIDTFAISTGLWYLGETQASGILLPVIGLPVEEALFFIVTNLFITQGLFLLYWVSDQTDLFSDYQNE